MIKPQKLAADHLVVCAQGQPASAVAKNQTLDARISRPQRSEIEKVGLLLIGVIILARAFLRAPRLYRGQAGTLLLGALLPWASNIVSLLGGNPFPGLDLTPIVFTVTGLVFAWGLMSFRLLDIVPVARDLLVERMSDGVLVLDAQNRIVDINPAARNLLGLEAAPIGQPVQAVLARWPEVVARFLDVAEAQAELTFDEGHPYLDVRIAPLRDQKGHLTGRLIVWRDITELRAANRLLSARLEEIARLHTQLREQAIRDPLTGLFNRRYLDETFDRELARAERDGFPVSVVMLDIDHFKQLNDTFGHAAGDRVLRALADLLQAQTRHGDIACRLGGEEFVVVMPGATAEVAGQRADGWRQAFADEALVFNEQRVQATVSVGVATAPEHGRQGAALLDAVDRALYAAKAAGRNRVHVLAAARPPDP